MGLWASSMTIKHLPIPDEGNTSSADMYHFVHEILTLQGRLLHELRGANTWKPGIKHRTLMGMLKIVTSSAKLAEKMVKGRNDEWQQRCEYRIHRHAKSSRKQEEAIKTKWPRLQVAGDHQGGAGSGRL